MGWSHSQAKHYLLVDSNYIESVKVVSLQQTELFVVRAADLWLNKVKKFFDESRLPEAASVTSVIYHYNFSCLIVESASDRRAIH